LKIRRNTTMTTPELKNDPMDEVIGRLDPKTARRVQFANEITVERLPLASVGLTHALGGGIGRGRMCLVYGNQSAGKSLLAAHSVALLQDAGYTAAWLDVERAYDPTFAARAGVDNSKLLMYSHQAADKVTDEGVKYIKAGVDIMVVDSISDLISDAFLDKDGDINGFDGMKQIGAHAKAIRKMIDAFQYVNERTALLVLSQTTTDLSGMYPIQIPHGGKKVLFKSSQIVKLTSGGQENKQIMGTVQSGDRLIQEPIGRHVMAYVEKNKLGRQSTKAEYDLYYDGEYVGVDRFAEQINLAIRLGAIETGGPGRYSFDDVKWHGEAAVVEALRDDKDLLKAVNDRVTLIQTGELVE
jgi:recombination protein RecA